MAGRKKVKCDSELDELKREAQELIDTADEALNKVDELFLL